MVIYSDLSEQNLWWKFDDFEQKDRSLRQLLDYGMLVQSSRPKFEQLALKSGSIVLLRGPRRVGKTTYLKQLIRELIRIHGVSKKRIMYLDIEGLKITTALHLRKTIRLYFDMNPEKNTKYLFLDEITTVRDWETVLQGEFDNGPLNDCITFVTGSDPKLLEEGGYKLSGRGVSGNEFLVRPLTFRDFVLMVLQTSFYFDEFRRLYGIDESIRGKMSELLSYSEISLNDESNRIKKAIYNVLDFERELRLFFGIFLKTGGFPQSIHSYFERTWRKRIAKKNDENKDHILEKGNEIHPIIEVGIDSIIYEDIIRAILQKLNDVGEKPSTAESILHSIADLKIATGTTTYSSIGQGLKYEEENLPSLHSQTVEEYIKNLSKWMMVDIIGNRNGGYMKKIYIADPFILHSIRGRKSGRDCYSFSEELLENEQETGRLVECIVGSSLRASEEKPIVKEVSSFLSFSSTSTPTNEIDFVFKKEDGKEIGIEVKYQEGPSKKEINKISSQTLVLTKKETDLEGEMWFIPAAVFLAILRKSEKHL